MFPRLILLLLLSVVLCGLATSCAIVKLPDRGELSAVQASDRVVVLLRATAELPEGTDIGAFPLMMSGDHVRVGLGGFETGGGIRYVDFPLFLSTEARHEGWIYFILEPGIHYLIFRGAAEWVNDVRPGPNQWRIEIHEQLESAVYWRINIPVGSPLVYAGTMQFHCRSKRSFFGVSICDYIDGMNVENQEALAAKLAEKYLAVLGSPQTILLQRHEGKPSFCELPEGKRASDRKGNE
jgi:hypothetical protein